MYLVCMKSKGAAHADDAASIPQFSGQYVFCGLHSAETSSVSLPRNGLAL